MKPFFYFLILTFFILGSAIALSGEIKTVTLSVDKMTCNMCPITVKKALQRLPGVQTVTAKYEGNGSGWAKVSFDPSLVKLDDLTEATTLAGYPSRVNP